MAQDRRGFESASHVAENDGRLRPRSGEHQHEPDLARRAVCASECLDDDHAAAAAWAGKRRVGRLGIVVRRDCAAVAARSGDVPSTSAAGEQAVAANAVEAARQDVNEKRRMNSGVLSADAAQPFASLLGVQGVHMGKVKPYPQALRPSAILKKLSLRVVGGIYGGASDGGWNGLWQFNCRPTPPARRSGLFSGQA